ncbi:hypothetical protein MHYP_G00193650 [Metynnis hypsauchen]
MSKEDEGDTGDVVPSKQDSWDTQSQDSIVLVQIASLSMDMFTPGDFKGKFRKIQPKKRPTIIRDSTPVIQGSWEHARMSCESSSMLSKWRVWPQLLRRQIKLVITAAPVRNQGSWNSSKPAVRTQQ